jgi:xylulose-5-phosphate/fructose-6-phosphate phosphoketolase
MTRADLKADLDAHAVTTPPFDVGTDLSDEDVQAIDAYWRAANYLSVGQIYLMDNPLLREPLAPKHVKRRLLGHWGTTPGLNFVYAHMNRVVRERGLDALFVVGPGHGGPAAVANAYLEGSYSEAYADITRDVDGLRKLFRQFSFPGGIPADVGPGTPGSIHEGNELGYSLSHAYGAAFDNPDLLVCCVVGDREAETGPLATAWHANKFLDPATDGVVLPILHLNGDESAGPAVLARIGDEELTSLLTGYGHDVHWVSGDDLTTMHRDMARTLDLVHDRITEIHRRTRQGGETLRPRWPMIVLRTRGWDDPLGVHDVAVEEALGSRPATPDDMRTDPERLARLEGWIRSYRPEELFDDAGGLRGDLAALAPVGDRRMSASPHANGGVLLRDLVVPDFRAYAVPVEAPGSASAEATKVAGAFLSDVIEANPEHFRLFGPDDHLAASGRVMEVLSEHQDQGWLEGYLLTGRHGVFSCSEASTHVIDSMFNQHAKWLARANEIPWRRPVASFNYLLSSHAWRLDHNGFPHQDPGFIDHVANKRAEVVRIYLPPDTNSLLAVMDHCLRSRNYVNVVVAGQQPALNYLDIEQAALHTARGLGIWEWASNDDDGQPDVVLACCGDISTLEALAATDIIRREIPDLKVRFVNVVDLMRLEPDSMHPHGLSDREFDTIFTPDRPIIFAHHGYPGLIHRLTYRRANHANLHVRGYQEDATTTTPFDLTMLNGLDRFHLVMDVVDSVPELSFHAAELRQRMCDERAKARAFTRMEGDDPPEIREWTWGTLRNPAHYPSWSR